MTFLTLDVLLAFIGELRKPRVFSKGDWVGKRSSGVRSMSDIYFRCSGCLKLGDDFFFTSNDRVFCRLALSYAKLVMVEVNL